MNDTQENVLVIKQHDNMIRLYEMVAFSSVSNLHIVDEYVYGTWNYGVNVYNFYYWLYSLVA